MAEFDQYGNVISQGGPQSAWDIGGLGNPIPSGGLTDFRNGAFLSPGQAGMASGFGFGLDSDTGRTFSMIGDPMDLFGNRAEFDRQRMDAIARGSADRSINALRDQYGTTLGLQQPFLGLGQQGLSQIGQYQQGENFNQMLNEGSRQLRGSAAASGLGNSSAAARNMAGFVGNLTQEDMQRQYQQALNNIGIGQNAVGTLGQAAQGLGSGASSIYGNWGQNAAQNALGYGQARNQSLTGAGQAVAGLGNYLDYQGGR